MLLIGEGVHVLEPSAYVLGLGDKIIAFWKCNGPVLPLSSDLFLSVHQQEVRAAPTQRVSYDVIAALFIVAQNWTQPMCPVSGEYLQVLHSSK